MVMECARAGLQLFLTDMVGCGRFLRTYIARTFNLENLPVPAIFLRNPAGQNS